MLEIPQIAFSGNRFFKNRNKFVCYFLGWRFTASNIPIIDKHILIFTRKWGDCKKVLSVEEINYFQHIWQLNRQGDSLSDQYMRVNCAKVHWMQFFRRAWAFSRSFRCELWLGDCIQPVIINEYTVLISAIISMFSRL